jgi:hypothetical protein
MSKRLFFAILLTLTGGLQATAQTAADSAVSFGNRMTVASLVSTLQSNGYQALAAAPQIPQQPGGAPPVVNQIIGVISTGIGGSKVLVVPNRCPNTTSDEICTIAFAATFNDNKNVINDAALALFNQRTSIAKVFAQKKGDAVTGFTLMYTYVCKGLDDPKFVAPVLATFGADIMQVGNAYNSLPAPAVPAAKPQ